MQATKPSTDPPPLARLSPDAIEELLRGFPRNAVESARALREHNDALTFERFLLAVLSFYLPAGETSLPAAPSGDLRLREDLGLDSLALAEAMFKIEELFDIRVENAELADVLTLADARRILSAKVATDGPPDRND